MPQIGDIIAAHVDTVVSFGEFVRCELGNELLHLFQISWVAPITPQIHFEPGQQLQLMCIANPAHPRGFSLSLRHCIPKGPLANLKLGDKLTGRVVAIKNRHVVLELAPQIRVDYRPDLWGNHPLPCLGDTRPLWVLDVNEDGDLHIGLRPDLIKVFVPRRLLPEVRNLIALDELT